MTSTKEKTYRIQLSVAIFKERKLTYKNEMVVPSRYTRRSEARAHIKKEIRERLAHSSFFISPRVDYDLVRYSQEASCNTYLRYRIIEDLPAQAKPSETKLTSAPRLLPQPRLDEASQEV